MNPIGHQIIHLEAVDSTNNYTANLIRAQEIMHGTVIMADVQTNGRGQRGTTWQSQPNQNLTASIFLEFTNFPVTKQVSINHWITLGIRGALEKMGLPAKIKWPNDIYVNDQKICGILVENTIGMSGIKHSVIGFGLNVNQIDFESDKATSVHLLKGEQVEVRNVLDHILIELNKYYPFLLETQLYLRNEFHTHLWKINEKVSFREVDELKTGIIRGTNDIGQLEMEVDGVIQLYNLKEIQFI